MEARDIFEANVPNAKFRKERFLVLQSSRGFVNFVPVLNMDNFYGSYTKLDKFGFADAARICSSATGKLEEHYHKIGVCSIREYHQILNFIADYLNGDISWDESSRRYIYADEKIEVPQMEPVVETRPAESTLKTDYNSQFYKKTPMVTHSNSVNVESDENLKLNIDRYEMGYNKAISMINQQLRGYRNSDISQTRLVTLVEKIKAIMNPIDKIGSYINRPKMVRFADETPSSRIRDIFNQLCLDGKYTLVCGGYSEKWMIAWKDPSIINPIITLPSKIEEPIKEKKKKTVKTSSNTLTEDFYKAEGLDKIEILDESTNTTYYRLAAYPTNCRVFKTIRDMNSFFLDHKVPKKGYAYKLFTEDDILFCAEASNDEIRQKYDIEGSGRGVVDIIRRNARAFVGTNRKRKSANLFMDPYYVVFGKGMDSKYFDEARTWNPETYHPAKGPRPFKKYEVYNTMKRVERIGDLYMETFDSQTDPDFDFSQYGDQAEDLKWIVGERLKREKINGCKTFNNISPK